MAIELEVLSESRKAQADLDKLRKTALDIQKAFIKEVGPLKLNTKDVDKAQTAIKKLRKESNEINIKLRTTLKEKVEKDLKQINQLAKPSTKTVKFQSEGLNKLTQDSNLLSSAANRIAFNFGTALTAVLTFSAAIRTSDAITNLTSRLTVLAKTQYDVSAGFIAISDIALSSRAPISAIADLYTKISLSSKTLGATQREVAAATESVAKYMAASGASGVQAESAILQLGQALSSGVLQGDELRSIGENAPQLLQVIADGMGVAREQVRRLGAEGKLTATQVFQALVKGIDGSREAFAKTQVTYAQAFSNLGNAFTLLTKGLMDIGEGFSFAEVINDFAVGLAKFATTIDIRFLNLLSIIDNYIFRLKQSLLFIPNLLINVFKTTFSTIGSLIKKNLGNLDISIFTATLDRAQKHIKSFVNLAERSFFWLYDKVIGNSWIPDMVLGVVSWVGKLLGVPSKTIESFVSKASNAFEGLMDFLKDVFNFDNAIKAFDKIPKTIDATVNAAKKSLNSVFGADFKLTAQQEFPSFERKDLALPATAAVSSVAISSILSSITGIKGLIPPLGQLVAILTKPITATVIGIGTAVGATLFAVLTRALANPFKVLFGILSVMQILKNETIKQTLTDRSGTFARDIRDYFKEESKLAYYLRNFGLKTAAVKTLPESYQMPAISVLAITASAVTAIVLKKFLGIKSTIGLVAGAAIAGGAVAGTLTEVVRKQVIDDFFSSLTLNIFNLIEKSINLLFGGIFKRSGLGEIFSKGGLDKLTESIVKGTTVLAGILLLFKGGRERLLGGAAAIVTAPTRLTNRLIDEKFAKSLDKLADSNTKIASQRLLTAERRAAEATAFLARARGAAMAAPNDANIRTQAIAINDNIKAQRLLTAATLANSRVVGDSNRGIVGSVNRLRNSAEAIRANVAESRIAGQRTIINTSGALGGTLGSVAGFQFGQGLADRLTNLTDWQKVGVTLGTAVVGQFLGSAIFAGISTAIISAFSFIGTSLLSIFGGIPLLILGAIALAGLLLKSYFDDPDLWEKIGKVFAESFNKYVKNPFLEWFDPISKRFKQAFDDFLTDFERIKNGLARGITASIPSGTTVGSPGDIATGGTGRYGTTEPPQRRNWWERPQSRATETRPWWERNGMPSGVEQTSPTKGDFWSPLNNLNLPKESRIGRELPYAEAGNQLNKTVQSLTKSVKTFDTTFSQVAELIKRGESAGSYDVVNRREGNRYVAYNKELTKMTVAEVMKSQQDREFFAAGAYQFVPKTLEGLVKQLKIDPSQQLFDKEFQDKLFQQNLPKAARDYISGVSDDIQKAVDELAFQWRAIEYRNTGMTYPDSAAAVNKATISSKEIIEALKASREGKPLEKDAKTDLFEYLTQDKFKTKETSFLLDTFKSLFKTKSPFPDLPKQTFDFVGKIEEALEASLPDSSLLTQIVNEGYEKAFGEVQDIDIAAIGSIASLKEFGKTINEAINLEKVRTNEISFFGKASEDTVKALEDFKQKASEIAKITVNKVSSFNTVNLSELLNKVRVEEGFSTITESINSALANIGFKPLFKTLKDFDESKTVAKLIEAFEKAKSVFEKEPTFANEQEVKTAQANLQRAIAPKTEELSLLESYEVVSNNLGSIEAFNSDLSKRLSQVSKILDKEIKVPAFDKELFEALPEELIDRIDIGFEIIERDLGNYEAGGGEAFLNRAKIAAKKIDQALNGWLITTIDASGNIIRPPAADAREAGAVFAKLIQDGFSQGLSGVLKGEITFKDSLFNLATAWSGGIIDSFVNGLTAALFRPGKLIDSVLNAIGIQNFGLGQIAGGEGSGGRDALVFSNNLLVTALNKLTFAITSNAVSESAGLLDSAGNKIPLLGDGYNPDGSKIEEAIDDSTGEQTNTFVKSLADLGKSVVSGIKDLGSLVGNAFQSLLSVFGIGGGSSGGLGGLFSSFDFGSLFSGLGDSIGSALGSVFGLEGAGGWLSGLFFANGGFVSGAGTSTSDSIPAWLSNGEYVINAASTKKFLPILEAINNNSIPRFSEGGMVGNIEVVDAGLRMKQQSQPRATQTSVFNINVTGDISRQTRNEIQAMLPQIATGVNTVNRENGYRR
jgi:tape measure domain-containing protein